MKKNVRVQEQDFNVDQELAQLRADDTRVGAVVVFVGTVRDVNDNLGVATLTLEHYPGMTEKSLSEIVDVAAERFPIYAATVIHRIGKLSPTDQIVMVAVSAAHRGDAFSACEYIMDYLKTRAPFWKKEKTDAGDRWVDARESDEKAKEKWE
jgi:molybdopterin synthase catalytic subunit